MIIPEVKSDLAVAVKIMQDRLCTDELFYELKTDQQVFALLQLAAALARTNQTEFLKRGEKARFKWVEMTIKALLPELAYQEAKI